jgi:hypothetical protein
MCASHAGRRIWCRIRLSRWSDDASGDKLIAVVGRQSRSVRLTTHCTDGALSPLCLTLSAALLTVLLLTLAGLMPDDCEGRHGKEPREPGIEDWAAEHG